MMIDWTHIMIHHSLTEDSATVSWPAIRRYHLNQRWRDIGYHFGVEFSGLEYEALIGRPLDMEGSHCKEAGMNHKAIGVCVVGNYDYTEPSPLALDVLCQRILVPMMRIYRIPLGNIVFHRQFATYKTCPGTMFTKELLLKHL